MRKTIVLVSWIVVTAAALPAQVPDTARVNRMLQRLEAKLRADRTLPDSLRRLTAADLVSTSNSNSAALLDDSTSSLLLHTMAATMHQLPESLCGTLLGNPPVAAPDLAITLPYADSSTLASWSTILERIVHARARPGLMGRTADDSTLRMMFLRLYAGLDAASQLKLMRIAQHPPPSTSDACWSTRVILDRMAALPLAEAGPLVRAMFGKVQARR